MPPLGGASVTEAALQEVSFSCLTDCMTDKGVLVEEGEGEEVCLELIDLLFQGLLLLLGWGMAVEEEDEEDNDEGGFREEVAPGMLVEELTFTADDGACSVITEGCEVMPSEESAPEKRYVIKQ